MAETAAARADGSAGAPPKHAAAAAGRVAAAVEAAAATSGAESLPRSRAQEASSAPRRPRLPRGRRSKLSASMGALAPAKAPVPPPPSMLTDDRSRRGRPGVMPGSSAAAQALRADWLRGGPRGRRALGPATGRLGGVMVAAATSSSAPGSWHDIAPPSGDGGAPLRPERRLTNAPSAGLLRWRPLSFCRFAVVRAAGLAGCAASASASAGLVAGAGGVHRAGDASTCCRCSTAGLPKGTGRAAAFGVWATAVEAAGIAASAGGKPNGGSAAAAGVSLGSGVCRPGTGVAGGMAPGVGGGDAAAARATASVPNDAAGSGSCLTGGDAVGSGIGGGSALALRGRLMVLRQVAAGLPGCCCCSALVIGRSGACTATLNVSHMYLGGMPGSDALTPHLRASCRASEMTAAGKEHAGVDSVRAGTNLDADSQGRRLGAGDSGGCQVQKQVRLLSGTVEW